jgi:hypothetical protein
VKGHIYCTNHGKNLLTSQAFSKGNGWPIVSPAPLRPGAVFMYGWLRGVLPTLRQAQAEGRTWFYADNGYFRPGKSGYFRITRGALQHDGSGEAGPERWRRLGLTIAPWRKDGSHVLVCPPDEAYGQAWGLDHVAWLQSVLEALGSATDRPMVVRHRSKASSVTEPFAEALRGSWALVTCTSNAAVEALLAGVPVFCTHPCAAYRIGKPNLNEIEAPAMLADREQWAWNLAAHQWTLNEMRDGTCWRDLTRES